MQTIKMEPEYSTGYEWLSKAYFELGQYEAALEADQKFYELNNMPHELSGLRIIILAKMGKIAEAEEIFKKSMNTVSKLKEQRFIPSSFIAIICIQLGKLDIGFEWLEKGYNERNYFMTMLRVEPSFDSVRTDSRFKAILKKMNLE